MTPEPGRGQRRASWRSRDTPLPPRFSTTARCSSRAGPTSTAPHGAISRAPRSTTPSPAAGRARETSRLPGAGRRPSPWPTDACFSSAAAAPTAEIRRSRPPRSTTRPPGPGPSAGSLALPREHFGLVALPDGGALVVGGVSGAETPAATASAERFDARTLGWSSAGSMQSPGVNRTAVFLGDGRVLVAGGMLESIRRGDP